MICDHFFWSVENIFNKSKEQLVAKRNRFCMLDVSNKNLKPMNELDKLKQEIEELKGKLTGNMMEDMELRDKIHNLEMKVNGVKPTDSHFDCIGCGS